MNITKNLTLTVIALFIASFMVIAGLSTSKVSADGSGSPVECLDTTDNVLGSKTGTSDEVIVNVGDGKEVTGVCIKSGENMFLPDKHSDVLGDGTYENGCYTVSGVGTQEVKVVRNFESRYCQGISHIDVVFDKVDAPCDDCEEPEEPEEPVVPETPGQVLGDQTTTPTGGVNAGTGPVATGSLIGLSTSLSAVAYGIRRLHKND